MKKIYPQLWNNDLNAYKFVKKGRFKWNEEAKKTLERLKHTLTTMPTLALPNFIEPFVIEKDNSNDGIKEILTQRGQPIAYMSKTL